MCSIALSYVHQVFAACKLTILVWITKNKCLRKTNLELKKEKSGKWNVLSVAPNSAHSGHGYFSSKDNNLSRQEGKG